MPRLTEQEQQELIRLTSSTSRLPARFGIDHTTIQVETEAAPLVQISGGRRGA